MKFIKLLSFTLDNDQAIIFQKEIYAVLRRFREKNTSLNFLTNCDCSQTDSEQKYMKLEYKHLHVTLFKSSRLF